MLPPVRLHTLTADLSSPCRTTSYHYLLASLRNLTPDSPHAESSAIQAISTSLKLPSIFDFDALFKIDAIIKLQGHELFSLLKVFLSGGLEDYQKWESEHSASIEEYGHCLRYRIRRLNTNILSTIRTR